MSNMPSLERLPPEILQEVVSYLHDGYERHRFGGYDPPLGQHEIAGIKRRSYLASLRAVNRLFCQIVTPILFQHAIIYSGSVITRWGVTAVTSKGVTGTARLVKLSKDPSLRKIVRRLEICLKVRGPNDFQDYKPAIEEKDKDLEYLARLGAVIHSALPKFPNLKALKLNFEDIPYNFRQDFDDPGQGSCCWVQDTQNFFESLSTALYRSGLKNLEELDLSLPLAYDFGHFLDDDEDRGPHSPKTFFKQLKRLSVHYGHCTEEDEDLEFRYNHSNDKYDKYVRQLIPLATNLNTLKVKGPDVLVLDSSALDPLSLEVLDLQSLSITGEALISLFERSTVLREVVLMGVYLESGTWQEILTTLSKTRLTAFYIETCGYQKEGDTILHVPVNLTNQANEDDSYIETNRTEDIDACELVFARVHENMRQIYGSKYDEAAAEEKRKTLHEDIIRKTGSLGEFCRRFFAEIEEDEDGDSSEIDSSEDGTNIADFLEIAFGGRPGDTSDDEDSDLDSDDSSDVVDSSDSGSSDDE
ncbi:hypothetical protein FOYG_13931 [Fusarium oxysporum NRRL 32931]|uniref:Uncharacterized protein n=1 Tax=Fusarium oxysporum NRRL 32931 TaxID=660029 RepID=W9HNG4_FUSOX|nr:hypothetical protein FOYG_13931 [Fusarium oxysporum NRRL 32931]